MSERARIGAFEVGRVVCGDALALLRGLPEGCVDAVVTDPPYGCGKAEWDTDFPEAWFAEAQRVSAMQAIITGACGLADSVPLVGAAFVDVLAAWNVSGMTRGPVGFNNWLATVIAGRRPRQGQNVLRFAVRGDMPEHPSPKPIEFMQKLILRITDLDALVLDPFAGSGTTGVACVQTGRRFIGCDINQEYVDIANKRLAEAEAQPRLFDAEPAPPPTQLQLGGDSP